MIDLSRRDRARLLAESLLDWLPSPRSATFGAEAGPALSRVRCTRCSATGRVRGEGVAAVPCQDCRAGKRRPHGCRPCLACNSDGWKRPRRMAEATDDPALNEGATELLEDSNRRTDLRRRYRMFENAAASFENTDAAVLNEIERAVDYGLREQRRMFAEGSYRELGQCLVWLGEAWPEAARLVWRSLVYAEPLRLGPSSAAMLEDALDWIAERMPAEIRVPPSLVSNGTVDRKTWTWRSRSEQARVERESRDEHIARQAGELGWSVGRIADVNALSERRVRQILGGTAA